MFTLLTVDSAQRPGCFRETQDRPLHVHQPKFLPRPSTARRACRPRICFLDSCSLPSPLYSRRAGSFCACNPRVQDHFLLMAYPSAIPSAPNLPPDFPALPCCILGIRCRPDCHPVREGDLCTGALSASLYGFSHGSYWYLTWPCELVCVSVYCLDSQLLPQETVSVPGDRVVGRGCGTGNRVMYARGGCGWPPSDPPGTSPLAHWRDCFCSKHLALLTHFSQRDTAYLV